MEKIYCNRCKQKTNHKILKRTDRTINDDDSLVTFTYCWQILQCKGCDEVSFRYLYSSSDDYDPDTLEERVAVLMYPTRNDRHITPKIFFNVPSMVRKIYQEAISAYNNSSNLLCAAGLRAIIEAICNHEQIKDGPVETVDKNGTPKVIRKKDLMGKINGLHEKGIISKKQIDVLHEQRYLGNEAIHEIVPPRQSRLTIAIQIIEAILEQLYEVDAKALLLKISRKRPETKTKTGTKTSLLDKLNELEDN